MSRFVDIDLTKLTAPKVVEVLSYEDVLANLVEQYAFLNPNFTAFLESEPVMKGLELAAYREMMLRNRINVAAKMQLLAFATGSDLDHIGVTYYECARLDGEKDDPYRRRIQLSPESYSSAGPEGAYIFHALSASAKVRDVDVDTPTPGTVVVTVLSTEGDGTATERETVTDQAATLTGDVVTLDGVNITNLVVSPAGGGAALSLGVDYTFNATTSTLTRVGGGAIASGGTLKVSFDRAGVLELVRARLTDEDLVPDTDHVIVQSATIVDYVVEAVINIFSGPDETVVAAEARTRLVTYVTECHKLGVRVTESGLKAALHAAGVQKVIIAAPAGDVIPTATEAPYCTGITITPAPAE